MGKIKKVKTDYFRFEKFDDKSYLVTGTNGGFVFLSREEFENLADGKFDVDSPRFIELKDKGIIAPNLKSSIERYRKRHHYLFQGPHLHIVVPTLRCNLNCVYCHASRRNMGETGFDMSEEVARKSVDMIFESPAPFITIEFQGGEPLANFPIVKFIADYAIEKNMEARKELSFVLVSNLTMMDDEKLEFIIDRDILLCSSLDGPEVLHNKNRVYSGANSYQETIKWIDRIHQSYKDLGRDLKHYHVDALMTTSRFSMDYPREIVEEYLSRGVMSLHVRPLNPFGMAKKVWKKIGYTAQEFLDFYQKTLDVIIEKNLQGHQMIDRGAALILAKILSDNEPNFLDLRSPCGAGIGQIAYNYDGNVFTCDEGRMMYYMGDDAFKLGNVLENSYQDIAENDVIESMCIASCMEALPGCSDCVYMPYCGVCPIFNYAEQGNIFAQIPNNERHVIYYGMIKMLFEKLKENDEKILEIFNRWIINRRILG